MVKPNEETVESIFAHVWAGIALELNPRPAHTHRLSYVELS